MMLAATNAGDVIIALGGFALAAWFFWLLSRD